MPLGQHKTFVLYCPGCEKPIVLPRSSPLGNYADEKFIRLPSVPLKLDAWPFEFVCLTCERVHTFHIHDQPKRVTGQELEKLACALGHLGLCQREGSER